MNKKSLRTFLLILLCLVLLRGLIYGLVIPADQYPDEFHHFKLIKSKQLDLERAGEQERRDVAAQLDYDFYYMRNPETTRVRTLDEFQGASLQETPSSAHIYYFVTAWVLKVFSLAQIPSEFYLLRTVSMICGALVVAASFFSVRELFPENLFMIIGVPTFITFIPQFSAMNGAINNDKFAEIFAALVFFLMIKMLRFGLGGGRFFIFLIFVTTIGLAILSKRSTVFLLPLFWVCVFIFFWKGSLGIKMHLWLLVMGAGLVFGFYLLMKNVSAIDNFVVNHVIWAPAYKIKYFLSRPELYSLQSFKEYLKFFTVMYWSFWGVFGYMTIHLHHFWYVAAAALQILSIVGLIVGSIKMKIKNISLEGWKLKSLYLFVISIVGAVLIPFFRSNVFRKESEFVLSQGRYLFPVIIPIGVLTILGLSVILPYRFQRLAGGFMIFGLILLDVVCLSNYLLLNFHFISLF